MKVSYAAVFALFVVGCTSTHQGGPLTAQQATIVATQLANDKASKLYHCQPFRVGQLAKFVDGRWICVRYQGVGRGDIQATVELALDGSTNNVDLQLFDSQDRTSRPYPGF